MLGTAVANEPALDSFLGQRRVAPVDNPHADRFAYMPGVFIAQSEPLKTGYKFFPQGQLIRFQTFTRGGLYNIAHIEKKSEPISVLGEVTARDALAHATVDFAAYEDIDTGFTAIDALINNPDAQKYFDIAHPSFAAIGHVCEFGLAVCPTCRVEMIASADYQEYLDRKTLEENLDLSVMQAVVSAIQNACDRYRAYAASAWSDIVQKQEIAKNQQGMVIIGQGHHHWRKSAHIRTAQEQEDSRFARLAGTQKAPATESEEIQALRAKNAANEARLAALEAKFATQDTTKAPVALCGDSGGTTTNGEPCKMNATKDGRCGKHQVGEQVHEIE